MSKRLGGIIGCKDETSSWHLIGFRVNGYYVGEKSTMILSTYINRHAGTPNKTKHRQRMHSDFSLNTMSLDYSSVCYVESRIG